MAAVAENFSLSAYDGVLLTHRENKKDAKIQKLGLWEAILKDVATASHTPDSTLLVLGRPGIGKRTLLQALLKHAIPGSTAEVGDEALNHSRAVALDYAYLGARDPDASEAAAAPDFVCPAVCSALILEDTHFEPLLQSRLAPDQLRRCAAVICLDLKEPWHMMEDLRRWLEVLQRGVQQRLLDLPLGEQDDLRARVAAAVQNYVDFSEEPRGDDRSEEVERPPPPTCNLGIPVVVVVMRADGASALETQKTIGWAETIEAHLRDKCLEYGAALIYTMALAKNYSNIDTLYDYLMHRIYDYPLRRPARAPSRDALFAPSGWDSREKIDSLAATLQDGGLERAFEAAVVPPGPPGGPAQPTKEEAEDMHTFLKRAMGLLARQPGGAVSASQRPASSARAPATVADVEPAVVAGASPLKSALSRGSRPPGADGALSSRSVASAVGPPPASASATAALSPGAGLAGGAVGGKAPDNTAVASFFQNLIERGKAGGAGAAGAAGNAASSRSLRTPLPGAPGDAAGGSRGAAAPP